MGRTLVSATVIRFREQRVCAQFHTPKDLALGLGIYAGELAESSGIDLGAAAGEQKGQGMG
jgi:hypothetical protein